MKTSIALLGLLLAATSLFSSCALMAGAAAGGAVYNEFAENKVYEAKFELDAETVWHSAKATLSHMATDPIDVDSDSRSLTAKLGSTMVIVSVETFDLNQCVLRIEAKYYGVVDAETGNTVLNKIRAGLETQP